MVSGTGGVTRCFSSHSLLIGFWWRRMKCTLLVSPHLSGPNMMVYGVSALNPSCESASDALSSFMYAPPHCRPFLSCSSYWMTRPLPLGSIGSEKMVETACLRAGSPTTRPLSALAPYVSWRHRPEKSASLETFQVSSQVSRKGSKKKAPSTCQNEHDVKQSVRSSFYGCGKEFRLFGVVIGAHSGRDLD